MRPRFLGGDPVRGLRRRVLPATPVVSRATCRKRSAAWRRIRTRSSCACACAPRTWTSSTSASRSCRWTRAIRGSASSRGACARAAFSITRAKLGIARRRRVVEGVAADVIAVLDAAYREHMELLVADVGKRAATRLRNVHGVPTCSNAARSEQHFVSSTTSSTCPPTSSSRTSCPAASRRLESPVPRGATRPPRRVPHVH